MNDKESRIEKDMQDVQDRQEDYLPHFRLTNDVLGCCFAVMKELGPGLQKRSISCHEARRSINWNIKGYIIKKLALAKVKQTQRLSKKISCKSCISFFILLLGKFAMFEELREAQVGLFRDKLLIP